MTPEWLFEEYYSRFCAFIARYLMRRTAGDIEDDVATATEALWKAALSYDPSAGAAFLTYAITKGLQAIIDEDRHVNGRTTSKGGRREQALSLCVPLSQEDDATELIDTLRSYWGDPHEALEMKELLRAVSRLPKHERRVIVGVMRGESGQDIAAELRVTESRVSQIRSAGTNRLRHACLV